MADWVLVAWVIFAIIAASLIISMGVHICEITYELDNGVVCARETYSYGNVILSECSDNKKYVNPISYMPKSNCTK